MKNNLNIESMTATEPDLILTVNPRIMKTDSIEMPSILDGAFKRFAYKIYGSKWKTMLLPLVVLNPEIESRRTRGSQHQMLHYHGGVWTRSKNVINAIQSGALQDSLAREIADRIDENFRRVPKIHCETFDSQKGDWFAYTRKNFSHQREFTNEDTYVFGHQRHKKSNSINRTN